MSKVIDSFLVALGFDLDEESQQQVNKAIDKTRSTALMMGKALAVALSAGGYAAKRTAHGIDQINNQAKLLANVSTRDLDVLGRAIDLIGGNADEAAPTLERLEEIITGLKVGEGTGLIEDLAKLGIPTDFILSAKTSLGLLKEISSVMEALSPEQQNRLAGAFGLSDGANLLVRQGAEGYARLVREARSAVELNDRLLQQSRDMTRSFTELGHSIADLFRSFTGGAGDDVTETIKSWTRALKSFVDEAEKAGEFFGDIFRFLNPDSYASAGGSAESSASISGQRARRMGRKSYGASSGVNQALDYALDRAQTVVVQAIKSGTRDPATPGGRRRSRSNVTNHIDRIDIRVDGSGDPQQTAEKVVEQINKAAAQVIEESRSGVAG